MFSIPAGCLQMWIGFLGECFVRNVETSFPSFQRRGARDHKLNGAKPPITGAGGVVSQFLTTPSAPQRNGTFSFMAQQNVEINCRRGLEGVNELASSDIPLLEKEVAAASIRRCEATKEPQTGS